MGKKMKHSIILLFCLLSSCLWAEENGVDLTINVTGITQYKGLIRIGVFRNEEDYKQKINQIRKGSYPAIEKSLSVTYQHVPPGTYSIILYHDINENDRNDSNALGIPKEPFGFSHNIIPGLSLPPFEKTKFEVTDKNVTINVNLQTFKKRWSAGVASIVSSSPYVDRKPHYYILPVIAYQGDNLSVMGPQATYTFYRNSKIDFSLAMRVNFEGYNSKDSDYFDGLSDRKLTLEGGLEFNYHFRPKWNFKADAYRDILGISNGMRGTVSVSRTFGPYKWNLTPSIGLKWENENYVDYYYGVQESEANSDRPEYHPGFSVNPVISCSWLKFWGENWVSLVTVSSTLLSQEIQDSPLIEDKTSFTIVAAFAYRF